MNFPRQHGNHGWALLVMLALFFTTPAKAWFGPSAESPYVLALTPLEKEQLPTPVWTWVDARAGVELENRPTRDGYRFGDTVFRPRPLDYLSAEFLRQVALHEERSELLEKLSGKTIRLVQFDATVGLWLRLSEKQSGKWETVRILAVIDVDGSRYESNESHPFKSAEKPSPVNIPMSDVVKSLVNQILLF